MRREIPFGAQMELGHGCHLTATGKTMASRLTHHRHTEATPGHRDGEEKRKGREGGHRRSFTNNLPWHCSVGGVDRKEEAEQHVNQLEVLVQPGLG